MNKNTQTNIISQLHRLQGQLNGVENMIMGNKKPSEIVQQIEAVCGSLKSLEKKLLADKINEIKDPELKKALNTALKN